MLDNRYLILIQNNIKYEPLPERIIAMDSIIRERGSIHSSTGMAGSLLEYVSYHLDR